MLELSFKDFVYVQWVSCISHGTETPVDFFGLQIHLCFSAETKQKEKHTVNFNQNTNQVFKIQDLRQKQNNKCQVSQKSTSRTLQVIDAHVDRRISNNTVNTHEVTQELGPKQQEHVFSASGSGQSLEQNNYNCSADNYFIKGG